MADETNGWRGMVAEKLANIERQVTKLAECVPEMDRRLVQMESSVKVQWWLIALIVATIVACGAKVIVG